MHICRVVLQTQKLEPNLVNQTVKLWKYFQNDPKLI